MFFPQFRVHVSVNHRNFYVTALLRLHRLDEAKRRSIYLNARRLSISYRNIKLAQELGIQIIPIVAPCSSGGTRALPMHRATL